MKAGLIGCGAIGRTLAKYIDKGKAGKTVLATVYDTDFSEAEALSKLMRDKPYIAKNFNDFLSQDLDLVIEAASQKAVLKYAQKILETDKDVLILSVGALLDRGLRTKLENFAKKNNRKIYVPTGAIAGLDAIKASKIAKTDRVELVTIKNPMSYREAPYIKAHKVNLKQIDKRTVLYRGPADEAVKAFPSNINV
ncbi:MAG: aspartate dehydrogenase, partial [Candidatus Bathyarchaeota archaeon]